uniref:Uncharacterized protein n=1 Tax=Anguilla anguilla TaxID=7936 RepID=A0A0E9QT88_ANGAN
MISISLFHSLSHTHRPTHTQLYLSYPE